MNERIFLNVLTRGKKQEKKEEEEGIYGLQKGEYANLGQIGLLPYKMTRVIVSFELHMKVMV